MKKLLLSLFLGMLCIVTQAQTKTFVASGVEVSNNKFSENLELGRTFGKNSLALIGTMDGLFVTQRTNYTAGVKYSRTLTGDSVLYAGVNTAVRVMLTGGNKSLIVEPGVSATYMPFKWAGIRANFSLPVYEGNLSFRTLSAGMQVLISL